MKKKSKKNIGFDLGHPAHFHLFKNLIREMISKGHTVKIHAREKDILLLLLKRTGFDYTVSISKPKNHLLIAFIKQLYSYFLFAKKNKFNLHIGTSIAIGIISRFTKGTSYGFAEDDFKVSYYQHLLGYTFCHKFFKPINFEFEKKRKSILYPSYHELAYLHPNNFTPDINFVKLYNLSQKKYIIIRLSALKAHHDKGAKGISIDLLSKIKSLLNAYNIIESQELKKQYQIKPWEMHHILAYAKMIISDSQTMTIEGAVLGVPAIRINTFIDKSSLIGELEKKYKLAYGFYPDDEKKILNTVKHIAEDKEVDKLWQERRQNMLKDKIDLNQWMVDYFENEINNS